MMPVSYYPTKCDGIHQNPAKSDWNRRMTSQTRVSTESHGQHPTRKFCIWTISLKTNVFPAGTTSNILLLLLPAVLCVLLCVCFGQCQSNAFNTYKITKTIIQESFTSPNLRSLEHENGNVMELDNIAGCVSDTDIPSRPHNREQKIERCIVVGAPKKWKKREIRAHFSGLQETSKGSTKLSIKKLWFSFLLLLVWVVNLVRVFKVPCNKNFLFWHYWFFCTRMKIRSSYEPRETISCFPETCRPGVSSFPLFPFLFVPGRYKVGLYRTWRSWYKNFWEKWKNVERRKLRVDTFPVICCNLNLDGVPIASKSHTHPSHSQTSRLITSSLSLGVPVPRPTQCMRGE